MVGAQPNMGRSNRMVLPDPLHPLPKNNLIVTKYATKYLRMSQLPGSISFPEKKRSIFFMVTTSVGLIH